MRSENSKPVNVAVIGTGVMGKNHVRVYASMKNANVSLVAVADSSQANLDKVANDYPDLKINFYSDYAEMLSREKIQAVSVCVPTKMHFEVASRVMEKGIHCLVEKPLAANVDEAKKLIAIAEKHKVKLFVGHIERFNPVVQELKKRMARGDLGRIYKISSTRLSPFPSRILDVGVTIDLAVHKIDIINYLTESDVLHVFAETARKIHSKSEDLLIATIRFENDILGVINCNWLTPKKVREITITGEKGMFHANYLLQELYFYANEFVNGKLDYSAGPFTVIEGKMQKIDIRKKEPLLAELESFVDCVRTGSKPAVSGADGMHAINIATKLIQSASQGEVIKV